MLLKDLDPMIAGIGLPYKYYAFPKPGQAPPYIVYYSPRRQDLFADNLNYQPILDLVVELYTQTKRYDLEVAVESALTSAGLAYSKSEDFVESDGVFMITYETEVIITDGQ